MYPFRSSIPLKLIFVFIAAAVGILGFVGFTSEINDVRASASGPTPAHTNAPGEANCTECHTSFPLNSGTGSVTISGLPARYSPGQHIQLTVTTAQVGAVIYGFQMTAIDSFGNPAGAMLPYTLPTGSPQRMQVLTGIVNNVERSYVEHTIDGVTPAQFDYNLWTFTWNAPAQDVGVVRFYAAGNAANSDGTTSGDYIYSTSRSIFSRGTVPRFDFDGDGKTDVGIFRPAPGEWWFMRSSDGVANAAQFGSSTDIAVPADFTGDGKTDIAFFRPSTGQWFILRSDDGSYYAFPFGSSGDIACPADFDGDGKADAAVFRPATSTWFILRSSDGGVTFAQFGISTDLPVPADYDGDGKADIGVWRRGPGEWWIQRSAAGLLALQFGSSTDKAVVGDYTGDGKADIAFWRPSTGFWYILRSNDSSYYAFPFGSPGDVPVPSDYDGDGRTDPAVFRQPGAQWFAQRSTSGFFALSFGAAGDQPLPGAYVR